MLNNYCQAVVKENLGFLVIMKDKKAQNFMFPDIK